MSSFVLIDPVPHASWVTRAVRLDGDFTLSVAVDKGGTVSYSYYNLQGIPDDYTYKPSPADENLEEAVISKDGTNESVVFRIKMYYNASDETLEDYQIPRAWTYGVTIDKDNYLPGTLLDSISQTFPVTIWNTLKTGQNPPSTNTASAVSFDSQYTRLGSIERRREYLKEKMRNTVFDPMIGPITGFTSFRPIGEISVSAPPPPGNINLDNDWPRRIQSFWTWLEMLTRAISIDSNLTSEQKFVLLDGEIGLSLWDIFERLDRDLCRQIRGSASRDGWNFRKFGSVSQANSQSPWIYTAPVQASLWSTTIETNIDIGSSATATQYNWKNWLRS